jgi:predicted ATP-grasp superfamily ATP-dependent carboligase
MRVFIYEFFCAGGWMGTMATASLRTEGLAMLAAVLEDFARIPGVQPLTLVDRPASQQLPPGLPACLQSGPEAVQFGELAAWSDYTLVIAPECDGILETRCRWALGAGSRLLGPTPEAVRLAADKWQLARRLRQHGVPSPITHLLGPPASPRSRQPELATAEPGMTFPLVIKPRHGAGSQAAFLVPDLAQLGGCLDQVSQETADQLLVQPFVAGQPASVAFLLGPGHPVALQPAAQHLSEDGRLRYRGGQVPLAAGLAHRAVSLAHRAIQVVPGLEGYVGVDLVLGAWADGRQDMVLEINPRLTTSYVGLRALARTNLAEAMLQTMGGETGVSISWRPATVQFTVQGQCTIATHPAKNHNEAGLSSRTAAER